MISVLLMLENQNAPDPKFALDLFGSAGNLPDPSPIHPDQAALSYLIQAFSGLIRTISPGN
jgi:hypothetical protein